MICHLQPKYDIEGKEKFLLLNLCHKPLLQHHSLFYNTAKCHVCFSQISRLTEQNIVFVFKY